MALTLDAALEAIGDAGLKPADIDGVVSWPGAVSRADGLAPSSPGSSGPGPHAVIDALRLQPTWYYGGPETPGMFAAVIHACMAVATGMCQHVVVYRALNEATVWRTVTDRVNTDAGGVTGAMQWMLPFGAFSGPNWMGLYATRHMHEYGTTREQLAAIALNAPPQRPAQPEGRPAGRPDDGRLPVVEDDQRPAVPVRLRHRGRRRDGARSSPRASMRRTCPATPIHFEAVGSALHGRASWDQWEDMTQTAAASAGAHLWSRTDLKPADVDVANLYDGFTVLTLFWLEGMGFCGKGESGPFVEGGSRIALDGELPLATSGGQLSAGRLHGFGHLYEACLQLRGQADDRQVAGREGRRGLGRRRPARLVPAAEDRRMKSRQVQLVEYPHGPVQPSHFRVAEVELPAPADGEVLVRNQFTSCRPGHAPAAARERPGGLLQLVPAQRRDGRDPDRRRGRRVTRGGLRARRRGLARLGLARLRGGHGRRALARRRRHARAPRHLARGAGEVPRRRSATWRSPPTSA